MNTLVALAALAASFEGASNISALQLGQMTQDDFLSSQRGKANA
jgi:hypothetical protein